MIFLAVLINIPNLKVCLKEESSIRDNRYSLNRGIAEYKQYTPLVYSVYGLDLGYTQCTG